MKTRKLTTLLMAVIMIIAAAFTLAACDLLGRGNNDDDDPTGGNNNNNNNSETFEYGQNYVNNHLGDYWVVYSITAYEDGETDTFTMEQKRTSAGYYWNYEGEEMLFIKNGDNYDWYSKDSGGVFKKYMTMDKASTEAVMSAFWIYALTYDAYGSSLTKSGSEAIIGRNCDKYIYNYSYPAAGYSFTYTYWIDKATGVCLKYSIAAQAGGQKAGYEFVCSKFQTTGVTLPEYSTGGGATTITNWPAEEIASLVGGNYVPAFSGTATSLEFNIESDGSIEIELYGANQTDADAYRNLLKSSAWGFEADPPSSNMYFVKDIGDTIIEISVVHTSMISYTIIYIWIH